MQFIEQAVEAPFEQVAAIEETFVQQVEETIAEQVRGLQSLLACACPAKSPGDLVTSCAAPSQPHSSPRVHYLCSVNTAT
jgi:hypothetical protein